MRNRLDAFHHALSLEQLKTGTDYSPFWEDGNYTLAADGLKCPALIVHGLHDENVSTKQFEMMFDSFKKAGQNVKLLLHQGPHITPAMQNKGYSLRVNGEFYEDITNRWYSHYLYGIENGAEEMPEVLVQNNRDQHIWETADSWHTGKSLELQWPDDGTATINTDWEAAGINQENFDEKMSTASSNMNMRFLTEPLQDDLTIQGTVRVDFSAALSAGDPANGYHGVNAHDADKLTFSIGTSSGKQDDLKLTLLLCDVCDEEFESISATDPTRNVIPVDVVREKEFPNGGELPALDEGEFALSSKKYNVITRAYMDLCNPGAGYDPVTASDGIELVKGEYHNYQVFLNATRYTLAKGHRLAVVLGTEDPVFCLIHKTYSADIQTGSVKAEIPYFGNFSGGLK